jgi:hypothetical protein
MLARPPIVFERTMPAARVVGRVAVVRIMLRAGLLLLLLLLLGATTAVALPAQWLRTDPTYSRWVANAATGLELEFQSGPI